MPCSLVTHADLAQPRPGHGPTTLVWPVVFVVADAFLLLSIAALVLAQTNQIAKNITTNELANWHRCGGVRGAGSDLHPFAYAVAGSLQGGPPATLSQPRRPCEEALLRRLVASHRAEPFPPVDSAQVQVPACDRRRVFQPL